MSTETPTQSPTDTPTDTLTATCQCRATRITIPASSLPPTKTLSRCNCTSCVRQPPLIILPLPHSLVVVSTPSGTTSASDLGQFQRSPDSATHYFCQTCGIRVFAKGFVKEMGGDVTSVSAGCVEGVDWSEYKTDGYWDGKGNAWMTKGKGEVPFEGGFW